MSKRADTYRLLEDLAYCPEPEIALLVTNLAAGARIIRDLVTWFGASFGQHVNPQDIKAILQTASESNLVQAEELATDLKARAILAEAGEVIGDV